MVSDRSCRADNWMYRLHVSCCLCVSKKTTIHIKKVLKNIFKRKSPAVLYGGSVDGSNVEMFKEIKEIDGFLIGGASKSSKKFIEIIKNYYR